MSRKWGNGLSISILLVIVMVFFGGCACSKGKGTTETVAPSQLIQETAPAPDVMSEELARLLKEAQAEGALLPIYFDYDKSNIKADAKKNLEKTAAWLSKNSTVTIKIEGNCDARGTSEYNVALGERRANIAKDYLVKLGVTATRIETISWGKEKPACSEQNEACWSKNRRDDFVPTGK